MSSANRSPGPPTHIVGELGMALRVAGDGLHGDALIVPEMHVRSTRCLRTSILAAWTDLFCGLLAGQHMTPRVPVTLDLAVDLYREPIDCARVSGVGRVLKSGRSVFVAAVEFADDGGAAIATATASFMAAPDSSLTLPPLAESLRAHHSTPGRLSQPFAERAGCERREPGVAVLPRSQDGLNSSNTINGGLIALVVEEAALAAAPDGATLSSLAMRYLRPARHGPLVACAAGQAGIARVEVRDAGRGDRLAISATTRLSDHRGRLTR